MSFVEIYMEQIRDLLVSGSSSSSYAAGANAGGLKIRENAQRGIFIEELTRTATPNEAAMMELIQVGVQNRAVASTRMNKDSSRSHTILMLNCTRKNIATSRVVRRSTMYIVDLAGSEFVNKTNASGKVLQEAKAINKSLSALSNVIKALVEGKKHVPYRDSKLTRILQDSLGGSAKTCLILAASCSSYNIAETISTLRFGLRAKEIKNPAIAQRNEFGGGMATGNSNTGINGEAGALNGEFKELYQRAMEDVEEKNRTISELQRLLAAKQDEENQHLEGLQPQAQDVQGDDDESLDSTVVCEPLLSSTPIISANGEADESRDGVRGEVVSLEQIHAREVERLETANRLLEEENRLLLAASRKLDMNMQQLVVDTSLGSVILARANSSELKSTTFEAHRVPFKVWVETGAWEALSEVVDAPEMCQVTPKTLTELAASDDITAVYPDEVLVRTLDSPEVVSIEDQISMRCVAPCVHRQDAEALSRQIVELKLQLHYLTENTKLSLDGEHYVVVMENAKLKTRVEELEFQGNLCTVACNQLEMKNRACETRLSNQETHITCLQNSLQEYQALFKQQIVMSQEKCRLLSDELEFYKKLAKCSQQNYQYFGSGTSTRSSSSSTRSSLERTNFALPLSSESTSLYPSPTSRVLGGSSDSSSLWRSLGNLCKLSPKGSTADAGDSRITSAFSSTAVPSPSPRRASISVCLSSSKTPSAPGVLPPPSPTSTRSASSPTLRRHSNQNGSPQPSAPSEAPTSTPFAVRYASNPMLF